MQNIQRGVRMTPTSTPRLSGLSPKQNRTVPPIRPELARRLKAEMPGLHVELNGTRQRGAALPFSTPVVLCHSRLPFSTLPVDTLREPARGESGH